MDLSCHFDEKQNRAYFTNKFRFRDNIFFLSFILIKLIESIYKVEIVIFNKKVLHKRELLLRNLNALF